MLTSKKRQRGARLVTQGSKWEQNSHDCCEGKNCSHTPPTQRLPPPSTLNPPVIHVWSSSMQHPASRLAAYSSLAGWSLVWGSWGTRQSSASSQRSRPRARWGRPRKGSWEGRSRTLTPVLCTDNKWHHMMTKFQATISCLFIFRRFLVLPCVQ